MRAVFNPTITCRHNVPKISESPQKTKLVTVAADATVQYIYTYTVFGFWAKYAGSSQKPDIDTGDSDFF